MDKIVINYDILNILIVKMKGQTSSSKEQNQKYDLNTNTKI